MLFKWGREHWYRGKLRKPDWLVVESIVESTKKKNNCVQKAWFVFGIY